MKICLINNLYEPYGRGGAEQVVKNLAQGLKTAGHEVFIITTAKCPKETSLDGIKVYYIKPWNLFWFGEINQKPAGLRFFWHGLDMFNWSGKRQTKKILEKEKPDLVNTHNLKGISYLIPRLLKKMKIRHL
ncbi:MAG: glycosyltransferase, partial [bacterium]